MEPKLKAKELYNKMYDYSLFEEEAKRCALIAVEEIKEAIFWHPFESPNFELEYWQDVKQEIENL